MPSDAQAILETLAAKDLKVLAADHGVDLAGAPGRSEYVKRLADSEKVREALRAPAFRVRPILARRNVAALQKLAAELGVDVAGCEKKADYIGRIAASPAALTLLEAPPPPPPEPVPAPPKPAGPELGHPTADPLILHGRNQDVDFGLVEDILDQTRMRFEEQNFDRTLELSREALLLARGTLEAFEKAAWAYALLAAQRLIDESGRVGRDVEPAAAMLQDAKGAYQSGNLRANEDLLVRLQAATKALYSEDVRRLRNAVYGARDRIAQNEHVGADVAPAEEALARARDAMETGNHLRAQQLIVEAEGLAEDALQRRVQEIEKQIPSVEKAIDEARHVGAAADDAVRLLEKAKVAMTRKEYVLAAELVQRAERSTLESQHLQIQKAMELRIRQIEKARALVNYVAPIADEAAGFDLPIDETRRILEDARSVLDQGDYVNGTIRAKEGEEAVRLIVPRLVEERAKRGIARPAEARCGNCDSKDVAFQDDGWTRCNGCGQFWRWRGPSGVWEKFRTLLRE